MLAYRVTVDHTTKGVTLVNAITTNGNHCPADLVLAFTVATDGPMTDVCSTSNPVPSWTLRKDSDPATGDFVEGGQQAPTPSRSPTPRPRPRWSAPRSPTTSPR